MSEFELDGARPRMVSVSLKAMECIISLLEYELINGEFESDVEFSMVKSLLDECRQARESAGQIVWHKWPDTQPRTRGRYIVTEKIKGSKAFVSTMFFNPANPQNSWGFMMEGTKILAWAELPEPYEPEQKK